MSITKFLSSPPSRGITLGPKRKTYRRKTRSHSKHFLQHERAEENKHAHVRQVPVDLAVYG
ncbi:hypothetical protein BOTNAR_0782g00040 [Botryotinia narcissicola]|uniref:Uncharacterized protein n=1 Tax=Botryotinia narcissicola TaxID=278944 RepID=A0A4Z1HD52_9HELO|nr:hypothetical protein BOTNAR_0782g00040 [Botryotinia narcissicola]